MRAEVVSVTALHDAQAVDATNLTKQDVDLAVTPIAHIKRDEPVVTRMVPHFRRSYLNHTNIHFVVRSFGATTVCLRNYTCICQLLMLCSILQWGLRESARIIQRPP